MKVKEFVNTHQASILLFFLIIIVLYIGYPTTPPIHVIPPSQTTTDSAFVLKDTGKMYLIFENK